LEVSRNSLKTLICLEQQRSHAKAQRRKEQPGAGEKYEGDGERVFHRGGGVQAWDMDLMIQDLTPELLGW
jgi:hypothetical protein